MNNECICDGSSAYTEEKNEEDEEQMLQCNRIFLNFSREFHQSPKDCFKIAKVKDLFKCLSERQDLQEMKVSGWTDEEKPEEESEKEEEEEEGEEDELDFCDDVEGTPRGGGQRFAMSRDFWYRKLNTLKARKLDEVALEAKDIPPNRESRRRTDDGLTDRMRDVPVDKTKRNKTKDPRLARLKNVSSDLSENRNCIAREIDLFTETVAKPVEKELKKRFVNVYDNRKKLTKKTD